MNAAFLDVLPAAAPARRSSTADLVRLFALDRLPRRRLIRHWHREADGRLVCAWTSDLASPL